MYNHCPTCGAPMRAAITSDVCNGCRCAAIIEAAAALGSQAMLLNNQVALAEAHAIAADAMATEQWARKAGA